MRTERPNKAGFTLRDVLESNLENVVVYSNQLGTRELLFRRFMEILRSSGKFFTASHAQKEVLRYRSWGRQRILFVLDRERCLGLPNCGLFEIHDLSLEVLMEEGAEEASLVEQEREPQEHILQFFAYAHLPIGLQETSRLFGDLAEELVRILPPNPERAFALRKLLEAKDCAARAALTKG